MVSGLRIVKHFDKFINQQPQIVSHGFGQRRRRSPFIPFIIFTSPISGWLIGAFIID